MTTNYLAIDWGRKRVGLARANNVAKLAQPLPSSVNNEQLTAQLATIVKEEAIDELVVGLPRNLDGNETAQTKEVREEAARLGEQLELPVRFCDETLSSQAAQERVTDKFDIHSQAAVIILQDYLNKL